MAGLTTQPAGFEEPQIISSTNFNLHNGSIDFRQRTSTKQQFTCIDNVPILDNTTIPWIQNPRVPINQADLNDDLIDLLLMGPTKFDQLSELLGKTTLCHTTSSTTSRGTFCNIADSDEIKHWIPRLFFLALHHSLHEPAIEEYKQRKLCNTSDGSRHNNKYTAKTAYPVGKFEFQCPSAKFLVMEINNLGFGATLNTVVVFALIMSIRTGRIPIFWAESNPWVLAPKKCPHNSRDFQCYFLPMSPCVPTKTEVRNAKKVGVDRPEQRFLRRKMQLPPHISDQEKVISLDIGSMPPKFEDEDIHDDVINTITTIIDGSLGDLERKS